MSHYQPFCFVLCLLCVGYCLSAIVTHSSKPRLWPIVSRTHLLSGIGRSLSAVLRVPLWTTKKGGAGRSYKLSHLSKITSLWGNLQLSFDVGLFIFPILLLSSFLTAYPHIFKWKPWQIWDRNLLWATLELESWKPRATPVEWIEWRKKVVIKLPPVHLCGKVIKKQWHGRNICETLSRFCAREEIIYFILDTGLLLLKLNGLVIRLLFLWMLHLSFFPFPVIEIYLP